jgi:hypothetical protein
LLEQAVSHQFATDEAIPLGKPAALLQGLFDELPFHDGNAQTAFIAFLLLLDENGFTPNRVSFDDFFEFMAAIHEHKLEAPSAARSTAPGRKRRTVEDQSQLALILQWLEAHTRAEEVRDHPLILQELQRLLAGLGFECAVLQVGSDPFLEVLRAESFQKKRFLGLGGESRQTRSKSVARFPISVGDGLQSMTTVRAIRKACGFEGVSFYDWQALADSFIRQYQTLLVRLGRL